ncbi:MAG: preprotein translocase subunit SecD, partial [Acidimicrobiales bacterium]
MSPPSNRAQKRQRRNMLVSVLIVVGLSLGAFGAVFAAKWSPKLGLDLAGGLAVVYQTDHVVSASQLSEAVTILTNRVDGLGVSGASVASTGTNQISVSIPGVKDSAQVLSEIGQTAQLYFRPVLCYAPGYAGASITVKGKKVKQPAPGALPTSCPAADQLVTTNLVGSPSSTTGVSSPGTLDSALASYPSSVKDDPKAYVLQPGLPVAGQTGTNQLRYLEGPAAMSGSAVKSAQASLGPTGSWVVNMSLTGTGSTQWDNLTRQYFHEIIGIELDGTVQSAPINQPNQTAWSSFDGNVQISGNFTQTSAQALA